MVRKKQIEFKEVSVAFLLRSDCADCYVKNQLRDAINRLFYTEDLSIEVK